MAPEQRGEGGAIDQRTDIYALGVLLYRILTGKRPVGRVRNPSEVAAGASRRWDRIVMRCLEESPAARYQNAGQLLGDLRRLSGKPSRRIVAFGLAVAAVLVLAFLLVKLMSGGDSPAPRQATGPGPATTSEAVVITPPPTTASVTYEQATRTQTDAESAWRRIEKLDRGQGFGPLLDEAQRIRANADKFHQAATAGRTSYAAAKAEYDELLKRCRTLEDRQDQRLSAETAREAANSAAAEASRAGAQSDAAIQWQTAQTASAQAAKAFEEGRLADAQAQWRATGEEYGRARQAAEAVGTARKSATTARDGAIRAQSAARSVGAELDGGPAWEEAQTAASNAQKAFEGGDYSTAKTGWESASGKFAAAGKRAAGVASVRAAKAQYESALKELDPAKLATYGGSAWKAVTDAVSAAESAGEDFALAVAKYAQAKDLLPDAGRAADVAQKAQEARQLQAKVDGHMAEARRLAAQEEYPQAMEEVKLALTLKSDDAAAMTMKRQIEPKLGPPKEVALDLGNNVTLKLVLIPAGTFMMGSPENEKDRDNDEGPQHEVTISKAFYMGVTEVTQEQYEAVTGRNPSNFKGAKNPVEQVSWDDAVEFCRKLSTKTGNTVRLPTEAQWEYACRAGTKTPFNTGETISTDEANYDGNYTYGTGKKGEYREKTVAVGSFKPNAWGLYDMHGNVWEWCFDAYKRYAEGRAADPKIDGDGKEFRVLRGGSWLNLPRLCRSAHRHWHDPGLRIHDGFGFRVCLDLP